MATGIARHELTSVKQPRDVRRTRSAIERIEQGIFGLCVQCQQPIERMLLEADPLVECCSWCASAQRARDAA
jgi:RNA polymerase-binding transcription factor DksA